MGVSGTSRFWGFLSILTSLSGALELRFPFLGSKMLEGVPGMDATRRAEFYDFAVSTRPHRVISRSHHAFRNVSGWIPACLRIARRVPSGRSPG